jgi:hypothetical protein
MLRWKCRGVKQPKGQAYIKISEEEIADDYPMPKQYEMQGQEMDEWVVSGDEDLMLDVDPECLPKMVRLTHGSSCSWTPNVWLHVVFKLLMNGMMVAYAGDSVLIASKVLADHRQFCSLQFGWVHVHSGAAADVAEC